jgi:hypothetical protein
MFCPVCKAEYRLGFTHCSDCDVDLVENFGGEPSSGTPEFDDSYELLWSGNDPRTFQEFREALQSEGLSFLEHPPGPEILHLSLRPPMEIWTRRRDHEAVDQLRNRVYGDDDELEDRIASVATESGDRELTDAETGSDGDELEPGERLGDQYFDSENIESTEPILLSEDATAEVWSGDRQTMAKMLQACLRENGIGCVLDDPDGKTRIRVLRASENRAREIIREVMEATPPE